jgi:nucleotide-binding universal stress UspA family protein
MRIVLATDLGDQASELFANALKIALATRSRLDLLHVSPDGAPLTDWRTLPPVRELLVRWGSLAEGATYKDFEHLGVQVFVHSDIAEGPITDRVVRRVHELQPDLLVLGTHGRRGFDHIMNGSVAEPVLRRCHTPTLLLGASAQGLVDADTGSMSVKRVLLPSTDAVPQQPVMDAMVELLSQLGASPLEITVLHVGDPTHLPVLDLPKRPDWVWKTDVRHGNVVDCIVEAAREHRADLVAMATQGHDTWIDALRGSTTERVLRQIDRPLLVVPVE